MSGLRTQLIGTGRPRFAFLHGLFGRGRNWSGIAGALAERGYSSVLFDLPNHGASDWTDEFSYQQMADAVAAEIEQRLGSAARLILVGHSMGGKVAMLLALRRPELVDALVVIDIAPAVSEGVDGFPRLVAAMAAVELDRLQVRGDAEAVLAERIAEPGVRQFLLQNLRARPRWHWQPNLRLLSANLDLIAAWPDPGPVSYPGPVLWLRGERSDYVRDQHLPAMRRLFPAVELRTVADAGHWVQADNPEAVVAALAELADRLAGPA
ncbi:MAG: alpha/beta fold hydrolase [Propionicimonas sp.]